MSLLRFLAALTIAAIVSLPATAFADETRVMRGSVTYRERMALPPGARIEVKLVDVSLADAPAKTIASTVIRTKRQPPIPYRLTYRASQVVAGHSYALQARITARGQLLFINQTRHSVLSGGKDRTDILVQRVAAAPSSPAGRWLTEDISGGGVIDRLQTVLEIAPDGKVSGTGGCNRFAGTATIKGDSIGFGALAATMMACPPASMDQERKFFDALKSVRRWSIDPTRQKLVLLDAAGKPLVVLARQ